MKKDMKYFLGKDPEQAFKEVEVEGIELFKDEEGKIVPWVMRAVPMKRIEKIRELNTTRKKKKGGKVETAYDEKRILEQVAVESIVFPDFKDKEFLDSYSEIDPVSLFEKLLSHPKYYAKIISSVNEINGFGEDNEEDEIKEAKN